MSQNCADHSPFPCMLSVVVKRNSQVCSQGNDLEFGIDNATNRHPRDRYQMRVYNLPIKVKYQDICLNFCAKIHDFRITLALQLYRFFFLQQTKLSWRGGQVTNPLHSNSSMSREVAIAVPRLAQTLNAEIKWLIAIAFRCEPPVQ